MRFLTAGTLEQHGEKRRKLDSVEDDFQRTTQVFREMKRQAENGMRVALDIRDQGMLRLEDEYSILL